MELGRVTGSVVATTIYRGLEGIRLLIVQPLDRRLKPRGNPVVASREASLALQVPPGPIDHAIVAIVDAVEEVEGAAR